MASQTILFTALPHGFSGKTLKLSVYVSPRLTPDAQQKLKPFDDFLNWPDRVLNGLGFTVEFSGAAPKSAKIVSSPKEDLWKHLFNKDTYVKGYQFRDYKNRKIYSFPVANTLGYLKGIYSEIAKTPSVDLPTLVEPGSDKPQTASAIDILVGKLGNITEGRERFGKAFETFMRGEQSSTDLKSGTPNAINPFKYPANLSPFQSVEEFEFFQATRFYDRPGREKSQYDNTVHFPAVTKPKVDFHEMLAHTSDYPEVMRRLGIVIDLEIDLPDQASFDACVNALAVRIKPQWTKPASPLNQNADQPWTYLEKGAFQAAVDGSKGDMYKGMLKLNNASADYPKEKSQNANPYALVMLDGDGSVLKAINFAGNMVRRNQRKSYAEPNDAALPSLRSPGIGIVRLGRAYRSGVQFLAAASWQQKMLANTLGSERYYLDDIMRGYRVDIFDETSGLWLSLCKRFGDYRFPGGTPAVQQIAQEISAVKDEGYVKGSSATSDIDGSPDLYIHESLFRWDGWSLVAPRPGKTIARQTSDPTQPPEVPKRIRSKAETEFQLEVDFHPEKGTLPRLRYGRYYRMRARAVDLSGFSHDVKTAPTGGIVESNKTKYGRFEPVIPPAIIQRSTVTPGESVEHMVIRSNYDVTAANYVGLPAVQSALQGKSYTFSETDSRHVAPPKISQFQAEVHGMFDDMLGDGKDCEKSYNIALKEEGSFLDLMIVDTTTGQKNIPVNGIQLITPPSVPSTPTPPTLQNLKPGDALAQGQYVIHTEDKLLLPYLPDPFSRGTAFRGVPRSNASELLRVIKVPHTGAPGTGPWPDYEPFKIVLRERPGTVDVGGNKCQQDFSDEGRPQWDETNRILTIYLGKGEIARVAYSSYVNDPDIDQMGLWDWISSAPNHDEMRRLIITGLHWMFTPFRMLTLVHAVQQPLCKPFIDDKQFQASKNEVGQTFARIRGKFHLSVMSTGRLDLLADWEEAVDNLADPGPKKLPGSAHVCDFSIEEQYPDDLPIPPVPFDGDADATFRHEFHDTKHRLVNYHLLATTRFREYFPPEITQDPDNITREGEKHQYRVLNSARPDGPKILYVVPTFGWSKETIDNNIVSRRCGGLRVYMDRPWYSSGDEERLGVVLRGTSGGSFGGVIKAPNLTPNVIDKLANKISSGGNGGPTDPLKPFVTDWGMDPIWGSALPKPTATRGDFPLSDDTSRNGLSLAELKDVNVDVAAHVVDYDETRKLWYCDIEVTTGESYTPFIRLALARFQPYSINDCHLSRIVLADFIQIAPDRVAAVVFDSATKVRVFVSGIYGVNNLTGNQWDPKKFNRTKPETYQSLGLSRTFTAAVEQGADIGSLSLDGKGTPMWAPVPGEGMSVMMTPFKQQDNTMIWMAEFTLPELPLSKGGTKQYRIAVKEFEALRTDTDVKMLTLRDIPMMFRIVYADTIEL